MCGRARCTLRPEDVPRACHRHGLPSRFLHLECFRPSYNVAPGSYMPVLRRDSDGGVAVHCMKWGLVPGFTKKTDKPDFFKMFNARSESVAEKASFRRLLPKNRCLVTVDGFYEWKKEGSKKQPYYIHFKDERPLVFAALFDSWQNSGGETLYTFTILTTASSPALDWLHDRMPVILGERDSVDTWLDDPSTSKLQPLLAPYEKSDLVWYPVTPAIGKLSFDGPECIQQIPLKASQNSLISKFFSAKQPKTEERDKETISGGPKEEPILEGCEGVVVSESNDEIKQLDEEKEAQNPCFQKTVKAEPFTGDGSAIASSHPESVKKEGESVETGGGLEFTGESSQNSLISKFFSAKQPKTEERDKSTDATIPAGPKQERILEGVLVSDSNDEIKQVDEDKAEPFIGDSSAIVSPPEAVKKEIEEGEGESVEETGGGLETTREWSGKSGRKRDYELLSSAQENPRKQSVVRLQDDKSGGKQGRKKQGKGKSNMKKSKETTQSTLHFFFDEK